MIAALATIAFLALLLVLGGIAAMALEQSRAKVAAAFQGRSPLAYAPAPLSPAVRISSRARPQRPVRARARLRAAA